MKKALLLAGPSAVGKTTVMKLILGSDSRFCFIRSATTRSARGDGHDNEYIYLSRSEFNESVEKGEMLEYTEFGSNLYGTPKSEISFAFENGKIPFLILDLNGIKSVKEKNLGFDAVSFYIYDDIKVMESRLYNRELLESPSVSALETFMKRKKANIEDYIRLPSLVNSFDFFIKNENAEETAKKIIKSFEEYSASEARDTYSIEKTANELARSAAEM